jgi:GntR family transcriptional regulator
VVIDPNSPVPIYQQIGTYIRRRVAAGVYRPGEMVPSLRALALELTVNPNTVQRAYEALEREGLLRARKGLGMLVTEDGAASARGRSEAAVYSTFVDGIQAGRAADLPADQIRGTFERAWREGYGGDRSEA